MFEVEAKAILSAKNSMNIYRGCTHGCIYCDSRSTCYGMEHDFENVAVKRNAPALLEDTLRRKRERCMIGTGAMSDPYQPLEQTLQLTRRCLKLIAHYRFGVTVLTKSDLVLRDLDILKRINAQTKCVVQMTLTTFDEDLCRIVEPNVCTTKRRLEVLRTLCDAGIPTVVWLCPILPFINDTPENLDGILSSCFDAGVKGILCFQMGMTLRTGDREYYYAKLDEHFPLMKQRYIRSFGNAYILNSPWHAALMKQYRAACRSHHVLHGTTSIFSYLNTFQDQQAGEQLSLF